MGTLENLGKNLVLAIAPLRNAVSSRDQFVQFLYRLGWNATDIPPAYSSLITKVDEAVAALETLIATPNTEQALKVIGKVKAVVDAIDALSDVPPGIADATDFLAEIKDRLLEILVVDFLASQKPFLFNLLKMLGAIEPVHMPATANRPSFIRFKINWEKIPEAISHPDDLPEKIYGWGTPDVKYDTLFYHILEILHAFSIPVSMVSVDPEISTGYVGENEFDPFLSSLGFELKIPFTYLNIAGAEREIGLEILELPQAETKMPGIIIQPNIPSEIGERLRIREDINLRIKAGSNIAEQFGILIRPGDISVKYPFQGGTELPDFGFGAGVEFTPATSTVLLGSAGSTRIEALGGSIDFAFRFTNEKPELIFGFDLKGLALILQASESDGFIRTILGEGQTKIDIPLGLEWSSKTGIKFKGGGGFEISVSPHLSLGPISIEQMLIRLVGDATPPASLKLTLGANIKGDLGPLQFVVQEIGLNLQMIFVKGGNAGPFDFNIGFKPPNGVGLSVDSGVIQGGGFLYLDFEKGEYMGALELEFQNMFSMKAIGIINTKMPDETTGFSLLIIITTEFTPIQLGFGFALLGVGGLLGVNRTTRIDALREGIKTNALKSILFPEDVIANINRIVSDLKKIFPPLNRHFVIGPMAKIGWGTPAIISLEFGLLLEIPNPAIVILGVLKALLPEEERALLKLQVNFLGVIDFENRYISFDASLYDSRLLTYTLTGDMAFRFSWGENGVLILSVGGFHPSFRDAPPDLQHMRRLTINLLSGKNPRLTIESYFAVTSNTVQFGARAELYAAAAGFNVYGFVSFDVLFHRKPFHFLADIHAKLVLRRGTSVVMGIKVRAELDGPRPWDLHGEASVSFWFFSITIPFHEKWGEGPDEIGPQQADLLAMLTAEVQDFRNWKADIPSNSRLHVSLKKIEPPAGQLVIHPFGALTFSERLAPLKMTLDKFGNQVPKDANLFALTGIKSNTTDLATDEVSEQFARANFVEMSDDEKLSSPSFERMTSGFKIIASSDLRIAPPVAKSVDYELTYLRKRRFSLSPAGLYKLAKGLFKASAKGSAVSKSPLSHQNNRISTNAPEEVVVKREKYVVANISDMQMFSSGLVANSYTEASELQRRLIAKNPELKGQLQILSDYEVGAHGVRPPGEL